MGMSASQARLLQLEARQSNLEYQGQQINQTRTHLSQQATALYNSLLDMTVPTPPSILDYQTLQYKGMDGTVPITLGEVTPDADGKYDVNINYTRNGECLSKPAMASISVNTEKYNVPPTIKVSNVSNIYSEPEAGYSYYQLKTDKDGGLEELVQEKVQTLPNNTPIMHSIGSENDLQDFKDYAGKFYYQGDNGQMIQADSYKEAKDAAGAEHVFIATTIQDVLDANDGIWDDSDGASLDYVYDQTLQQKEPKGGLTEDQVKNLTFYDSEGQKIPTSSFTKVGNNQYQLPQEAFYVSDPNNGVEIDNPDFNKDDACNHIKIGDSVVQDFQTAFAGNDEQLNRFCLAIARSDSDYWTTDSEGKTVPNVEKICQDYRVYFTNEVDSNNKTTGKEVPRFVKMSDLSMHVGQSSANGQNRVNVYSFQSNGTYTEASHVPGCDLEFDTTGRITKLKIPNGSGGYSVVDLTPETVTDELAYKDAMNQYQYEQHLYDQKTKEVNAKTEIIQQEDRNLELKLQRLDNERTQITTEIDAVKKVINDNIQASYKTFSG